MKSSGDQPEGKKITFYHFPKTAGTTVRAVLESLGQADLMRPDHKAPRECARPAGIECAFIRHPVAWWRSLYSYLRYRAAHGKRVPNESRDSVWSATYGLWIWTCRWDGSLDEFLDDAWRIAPAMYSRLCVWFSQRCVLGRTERLLPDLCDMLDLGGVKHDRAAVLGAEWLNVSPGCDVPRETTERIMDQERAALEIWNLTVARPHHPPPSA